MTRTLYVAAVCLGLGAAVAPGAPVRSVVRITRRPYIQSATTTSAYIVWNTDKPAPTALAYWQGTGREQAAGSAAVVTRHVVRLDGLRTGTTYGYIVTGVATPFRAAFQTAKRPGQPFHFAVWGDSGTGDHGQRRLAARIEQDRPDFLVHTGDLIYDKGQPEGFDPFFFRIYAPTLARVAFYGCLGNHDVGTRGGQPWLDNFVLPRNGPAGLTPKRNYSFNYGDAHFVVIDANQSEAVLRTRVAPWLQSDLRHSRALWKFAVFHQPVYSSGPHGPEPRCQRVLAPILARIGVAVVLNGHDHQYERFKPQHGVVYIVTGAGGANRYKRKLIQPITACYYNDDWSFTRIAISGHRLHGQQIAASGQVVDDWSLTR